jgi:Uma2 family endonuclease
MPHAAAFQLAPDWVCEVVSPSTAKLDRGEKLPVYARERVGHVWIVDPLQHSLEVLRLDGDGYRIVGTHFDDAKVHAEPFDAIALDLTVLWAR